MFTSALKSFTSNISANYTISPNPSSTSGAWKVFDAKKKSTGKAVSVFVFDRKSLDPQTGGLGGRSSGASLKKLHDEVVSRVKKESNLLARLRHPSILELAEPIEDTRSGGLMFATEPVTASLAGLLQEKDDQERAGGIAGRPSRYVVEEADGQKRRRELEIDELEIQKGLLQIAQGLEFLHESASLVHGNLNPEAIYVNVKSDWKIAGLAFAGPTDASITQSTLAPISLSDVLYHDPRLPRSVQLNLDYTSPDFVLDSNISFSADMFSLGLLILALYNSPHSSPLKTNANISTYKKIFTSSSDSPSPNNNFLCSRPLPRELLTDVLTRLIARRPGQRMNAREFQQSRFFDNILVSSIRFLDALPAKTPNEKSQFLRGLPKILEQFPKSVLDKKVLPALLEETKDRELLSLILQSVFKIIQLLPSGRRAFTEKVMPQLREIFISAGTKPGSAERDNSKEAGLGIVLDNMGLIGENCSGKEFKDDILPILQLGLESSTHSVVDKSLSCLPTIMGVLDFTTIKNDLFPVVASVFSKTSSLAIKIRGLEAFGILCGGPSTNRVDTGDGLDGAGSSSKPAKTNNAAVLDKYTVQEKVVPLLKAIKTKEPAVMIAALAVFRQIGKMVDADFLAMEILPLLWSFSLGPLLNLQQFQDYMKLIKALSSRIEQEQTRKLSELSSNTNTATGPLGLNDITNANNTNGLNEAGEVGLNDFERLVLGKATSKGDDMLGASSRPEAQRAQSTRLETPVFAWSTLAPNPSSHSTFRAITPDQALSTLPPSSPGGWSQAAGSNSALDSLNTLTPMQPILTPLQPNLTPLQPNFTPLQPNFTPLQPTIKPVQPTLTPSSSPWSFSSTASSTVTPAGKAQPAAAFSIPSPPTATNSFSTFSIAPPPRHPVMSSRQTSYGQGLGDVAKGGSAPKQKTGLDAFESLL